MENRRLESPKPSTDSPPETSATRSIGLLGLVNIAMAVVGVGQAFAIGWLFGTTVTIETYFAAITFYQAIVNLMQTGQISEVFTPMYHQLKKSHNAEIARLLFSILLNWMVVASCLMVLAAYLLANELVPLAIPGFDPQRTMVCVQMFCWIVPLTTLQVCQSLFNCFLAAEKRFLSQELVRLVCVVLGLAFIIGLAGWIDAWAMVVGLWITNVSSVLAVMLIARKNGYRHRFRFRHPDIKLSPIFRSLPSIFSYVTITQIYSVALTSGLSSLPQGSLAIFSYARRIFGRLNGLLSRPISIVFFNHYSNDLVQHPGATSDLIRRSLRLSLLAACFVTVALLASGFPALKMLWLTDRFPEQDVWNTYLVLAALCFSAFFDGPGIIYRKINISHQLVIRQYQLLCIVQIACALLAYFMIPQYGLLAAVAIVVANPCLMAAASALLVFARTRGELEFYRLLDVIKCVSVFACATSPALVLQQTLGSSPDRVVNGFTTVVCFTLSLAIALAMCRLLHLDEPVRALVLLRNKIAPRMRGFNGV